MDSTRVELSVTHEYHLLCGRCGKTICAWRHIGNLIDTCDDSLRGTSLGMGPLLEESFLTIFAFNTLLVDLYNLLCAVDRARSRRAGGGHKHGLDNFSVGTDTRHHCDKDFRHHCWKVFRVYAKKFKKEYLGSLRPEMF